MCVCVCLCVCVCVCVCVYLTRYFCTLDNAHFEYMLSAFS